MGNIGPFHYVLIVINILCKSGEGIFINKRDIKVYVKM